MTSSSVMDLTLHVFLLFTVVAPSGARDAVPLTSLPSPTPSSNTASSSVVTTVPAISALHESPSSQVLAGAATTIADTGNLGDSTSTSYRSAADDEDLPYFSLEAPGNSPSASSPRSLLDDGVIFRQDETSTDAGVVSEREDVPFIRVELLEAASVSKSGSASAKDDGVSKSRSADANDDAVLKSRSAGDNYASSSQSGAGGDSPSASSPRSLLDDGVIFRQYESSTAAGVVSERKYVPFMRLERLEAASDSVLSRSASDSVLSQSGADDDLTTILDDSTVVPPRSGYSVSFEDIGSSFASLYRRYKSTPKKSAEQPTDKAAEDDK
ncbi:hypothetical protein ACET3Z_005843 [Daucus carota]